MSSLNISPVELILVGDSQRIDIQICDANGDPIDVDTGGGGSIDLLVQSPTQTVKHRDGFLLFTLTGTVTVGAGLTEVIGVGTKFQTELDVGDTITIAAESRVVDSISSDTRLVLAVAHGAGAAGVSLTKNSRIIKPAATTGQYYILWGDPGAPANLPNNTETNQAGTFLFRWRVLQTAGLEEISQLQTVKTISFKTADCVRDLRLQIDKAAKLVDDDPLFPCRTGYTDDMLVSFLENGLTVINAAQPYPTFCSIDQFPALYKQILLDSALLVGIMTQAIFAIDTDIQNYSDQGNAFVLDHFPRLQQVVQMKREFLAEYIPQLKLQFVRTGSIHIEAGANFRLAQLVQAAPNGALFRNFFSGIV